LRHPELLVLEINGDVFVRRWLWHEEPHVVRSAGASFSPVWPLRARQQ
jgi:hypothetical protein